MKKVKFSRRMTVILGSIAAILILYAIGSTPSASNTGDTPAFIGIGFLSFAVIFGLPWIRHEISLHRRRKT